jgi:hypothetical protein
VSKKVEQIRELWQTSQWTQRLAVLEKTDSLAVPELDRIAATLSLRATSGDLLMSEFSEAGERLAKLEAQASKTLEELNQRKVQLEKELPQSLVQLTEQIEYGRQFKNSIQIFREKLSEETVHRASRDIRERWRRFIVHATNIFSDAEARLSKAKIAAIDSEYKAMFKRIMNVGDVVPELERPNDREDLHVQLSQFHGQHGLSARALLSESYRNALAISVFLAAALKCTGPARFVVLDDITSSFDAGHQYFLMELIRQQLQYSQQNHGLQFIILSHDGLLEKYFDRNDGIGGWRHHRLQGSPPMGALLCQNQDANRLRVTIETLLTAGQVSQAEPLIRHYLEYKLQQIIRKVGVPVPIDFAMKDSSRMVSSCLDAINDAVELHKQAGKLVLELNQIRDLDTAHVPALVGNWVSHYETGSGSSLSAQMLRGIVTTIDDFAECFRFDDNSTGTVTRRWYKSLSSRT